ncbi:hypothetical protein [Lactococcus lactis]|uniref:hypothetical protein n=1 Tax=Lactococcus lactis TaxID=1358 RepID=UPI0014560C21|nr:hypothetical protein [Lactococcus lactis]MCT0437862.1 hypothetical protein [Lactococcus lactis subsp. lactis]MCT2920785.1 hypothetical protein [Lactococcus lactis]NLS47887.1 hypothetical protein [Lactococcus lactis]GFO79901.1 hypothetical protein LL1119B1_19570 [Lactococcus lactis]
MTDEKLREIQEVFIKRLSEFFPYKSGGKHKDFSKLDKLNLSESNRKHVSMSVNSTFTYGRISPPRTLGLLEPLFNPDEFTLFKEAYSYQAEKAKAIRMERAKTIHAYRKTIGRPTKSFSGGLEKGSVTTTANSEQVKIIKQTESGNYIVEVVGNKEKRLLGRDDMRLVQPSCPTKLIY